MLPLIKTEMKNGILKVYPKGGFKSSYVYDVIIVATDRKKINQTILKNSANLFEEILKAEQLFHAEQTQE